MIGSGMRAFLGAVVLLATKNMEMQSLPWFSHIFLEKIGILKV